MALGALARRHVQRHRDLGRVGRHAADVADVAVVRQLLAVVTARADRHLVLAGARDRGARAGVRDVGVAGEALVAGLPQAGVVDADVADDDVLLDLAVRVTLRAVVGADEGRDGALIGVGDVEDEVRDTLDVADEVVEDAGLGVALLAPDAGAVVGRLLVRGDLGLDDVAGLAGVDAVHGREADDGGDEQHAERRQHTDDPLARDVDVQQDPALERLLAGHHSPAPVAVDEGDADGSSYLTPLKSWWARGSPLVCSSWHAWQLATRWQLKHVPVPTRSATLGCVPT